MENLSLDLGIPEENIPVNTFKPFTFIDLFAGIGGFHIALKSLGGECVLMSEKDKYARETYLANHHISQDRVNTDIRSISLDDVPSHDILCAGFPCQPFSQAGKKKGFADTEEAGRGNLFFCIADLLEAKRPKGFILENVRHLIKHDDGKTFSVILKILDELDYQVYYQVLKASDFNVPQHRPRVFIVGIDKHRLKQNARPFEFPKPMPLIKTMSDIWGEPCEKDIGFTLRVGGKGSHIDDRRNWEFYRVNGEVKRIGIKQGKEMMGLPTDFEFPVSKTQAMKQLGNSVCVDVVKAVATSLLSYMQSNMTSDSPEYTPHDNKENDPMAGQNKGELSEAYAFFKIINDQVLNYADVNGNLIDDSVQVIQLIANDTKIKLDNLNQSVQVNFQDKVTDFKLSDLITPSELNTIIKDIKSGSATFSSQTLEDKKSLVGITKFKAPSNSKADLLMSFKQQSVVYADEGIGVKSHFGSAPTLLNCSGATNFIYQIEGLTDQALSNIIESTESYNKHDKLKIKLKERIQAIYEQGGRLEFLRCKDPIYEDTLKKVDTYMPNIIANALIGYFKKSHIYLSEYTQSLADPTREQYAHRLKDFIKNTMLGIFPAKPWNGILTANGCIVVAENGDLLFFHTNKDHLLKDYFFNRTFFDTGSLSKHDFGKVCHKEGKHFIKLNLQLRLKI